MYDTILVTLDGTPSDRAIIEHVKQLAKLAHSRLVLLHVADGWAARTYGPDAVSPEISEDTAYLGAKSSSRISMAAWSRLSEEDSAQLEEFHFKRQSEGLSEAEARTLAELVEHYERSMLIRARAAALLKQRGHDISGLVSTS